MKILIRQYESKYYVWKDAEWQDGNYVIPNTKQKISMTNILAVTEDNRIGYVQCYHCGKLIKNDPESIEQHFAEVEARKDCLKCEKMVPYGDKMSPVLTIERNADGTYSVVEKYNTKLGCRASYYYTQNIESEKVKRDCIYLQCRRNGVREINDAFVKYPGMFEKQITADTLVANKCVFEGYNDGYYEYDMKMRGSVKACVNEMGIVDHFVVLARGWRYIFYYSDKYKKIFFNYYDKYYENTRDYITDSKADSIIKKLSSIYEEAVENG